MVADVLVMQGAKAYVFDLAILDSGLGLIDDSKYYS